MNKKNIILFSVIILTLFTLTACSSKKTENKKYDKTFLKEDMKNNSKTIDFKESKDFKGLNVTVKNHKIITPSEEVAKQNNLKENDRLLLIPVTVKNVSSEEPVSISDASFSLKVSKKTTLRDIYDIGLSKPFYATEIEMGKSFSGELLFIVRKDLKSATLNFVPEGVYTLEEKLEIPLKLK